MTNPRPFRFITEAMRERKRRLKLFPRLVEALEASLPYVKTNTAFFLRELSKGIEDLLKEARGDK